MSMKLRSNHLKLLESINVKIKNVSNPAPKSKLRSVNDKNK